METFNGDDKGTVRHMRQFPVAAVTLSHSKPGDAILGCRDNRKSDDHAAPKFDLNGHRRKCHACSKLKRKLLEARGNKASPWH
jgi:hypothetical protein